jgi:hypothetical protein
MNHRDLLRTILDVEPKQTNIMFFKQESPVIKPVAAYGIPIIKKRFLIGYVGMP